MTPRDTPKNSRIFGLLNYDTRLTNFLQEKIEEIEELPAYATIHIANPGDRRWDAWKNNGRKEEDNEKCNNCDVAIAGYKTEALCKGCKIF